MKYNYLYKMTGVCGILLPIFFILILYIAIQGAPWFNWFDYAISDLGRPEYELNFFNYGLAFIGLLLLLFSFGLYYTLNGEKFGPTALALSSIYFIQVGIISLPDPTHTDVSSLFFIAFPIGFFLVGIRTFNNPFDFFKKMGIFALIITFLSIISPVFLLFYKGIAIPEMIILFPGFIWCMIYGFYFIVSKLD